ncbi:MAG: phage tail tape measure protein, partial [Porcipelethomonas sp.]
AVVAAFAIDKIKDFGQACIEAGAAFDAQMSTVSAISGATGEDLDALREKAKELGAQTSFSATESAQAMEYMAMAGWKTDDMLNGLEGVMNLAAASGENLATTSDIVTDAMTAFGMSADQSSYFSDVLAQTASNANTNVSMMGETFKYVAPLAGAMGYSIEDMSAAIGLMANAGIKGSQSGTSLRGIITNLASPTDTVASAMEDLGISLTDSEGKTKTFAETLSDLRTSFADLNEVQKTQYASAIAGKEGMSGLLALVNSSNEDFDKLTKSIKDCDGAAKKMSETRLDNLQGDVTLFKSAIEGAQIAISDKLTPVLRTLVEKATDVLPTVQNKLLSAVDIIMDIGGYLVREFSPILKDIGKAIMPLIEKSIKTIKPVLEKIVPVVKNIWEIVEPLFDFAITCLGAIIESIPDLIDGFLDLIDPLNLIHEEQSIVSEEYLKMAENAEKISEELDDIKQKNADIGQSILEEYDHYGELSDRLSTIVDQNGNIKEHCEFAAQQIIDELNPALDTSLEIVDGQLKGYQEISAEIDNIIAKKKVENILEKGMDNYNETIETRAEAIQERVKNEAEIRECEEELAYIQRNQEYFDTHGYYEDENFDAAGAYGRWSELQANIESLSDTVETNTQSIMEANNEIGTYEALNNAYFEGNIGAMQRYTLEYSNNLLTAGNATIDALSSQYDEYAGIVDDLVKAQEEGDTSVTDQMISTYTQLRNISKDEYRKAVEMAGEQGEVMPEEYANGVRSKTSEVNAAGAEIGQAGVDGINSKTPELEEAGKKAADSWGNNFLDGLHSNFGQIINTIDSYVSYLNGAGGSSSAYVNSPGDVALIREKISAAPTATGGIVTRPQTRLVGEDGAEAIVPLENNTQWIDLVAGKVAGAMGGGGNREMISKLDELIRIMGNLKIYLDGETLVGGIAGKMDGALGSISRKKRRGMA